MNKIDERVFDKASQALRLSQHAKIILNYLECVLKDKRQDPDAVAYFIKGGGLSNVYDNLDNIQNELVTLSNELTEISDELEGENE